MDVVVKAGEQRDHLVNVRVPAIGYNKWKDELHELGTRLTKLSRDPGPVAVKQQPTQDLWASF